ncbi:DMT family transporter [Streptomyces sp. NPDC056656]|uniref:DMT family transporter n=1 Tax=Streptomyces sp. NPDC056656 TaxID=3345895 RepID=UPI0036BCE039
MPDKAVAQAGYTALSQKARADVSAPLFSTVRSLVCGLELLAVCRLADIPLTGFDESAQLSLLGPLLLRQLLGLGSLAFALGRTSATTMSVLLLLETAVAALAAWSLMGQSIEPATIPGLPLTIDGVTVVVTSGDGEQTARRQGKHRQGIRPYPSHAPHSPHLPSTTGEFTTGEREHHTPTRAFVAAWPMSPEPQLSGHHAKRDPRAEWAGLSGDESPTITLTCHGAGAFDAMYLGRPHLEEARPTLDDPIATRSDTGRRP